MLTVLGCLGRWLTFCVGQFICFSAAGAFIFRGAAPSEADAPTNVLLSVLGMIACQGVALASWRWWMPRQSVVVAVTMVAIIFGMGTAQTQIETAVFLSAIDGPMLTRIVLMGAMTAVTATGLALVLFRAGAASTVTAPIPLRQAAIFLLVISIAHVGIYFVNGYFVVWTSTEARAFYSGGELAPFIPHILSLSPAFWGLQVLRGLGWGVLILGIARFGPRGAVALGVTAFAMIFAFGSAPLFVPNEFMPGFLRGLHLIETTLTAAALAGMASVLVADRRSRLRR